MIIYIHGFGSCGLGNKATLLRQAFKHDGFIAPSLANHPELAMTTLCELVESYQKFTPVYLLGSSLGGYYALYLAHKYRLKAVLINPSLYPFETLSRATGMTGGENFYDASRYEWNLSHLECLRRWQSPSYDPENLLLLLQQGDEIIDYSIAATDLAQSQQIIEAGGDHGFQGLERHEARIRQFFQLQPRSL